MWRDPSRRNRLVLIVFAVIMIGGMLYTGFTSYLFAGDQRVLVVTLANNAGQDKREGLKAACGTMPGVSVVADRGNPDPAVQGRFPVRFDIAGIDSLQYADLIRCLDQNQPRFLIVGYLPEKDGI